MEVGDCRLFIVFGGLPGTGKTTISRAGEATFSDIWLGIDVIEQAMPVGMRWEIFVPRERIQRPNLKLSVLSCVGVCSRA